MKKHALCPARIDLIYDKRKKADIPLSFYNGYL